MNTQLNKAVIFAPFWNQPGHVGNYRVDRFIRWLSAQAFEIVLIRAGSHTQSCQKPWGIEVTIKDPLGLYRDPLPVGGEVNKPKPRKFRRLLAYRIFNPEPSVLWAYYAARHPMVLARARDASFVLSSSPPESAHVGAAKLAKKIHVRLVIDLRDGWLDEPLRPLLRNSAFQRWREGRLEKKILKQADIIFVTSPIWLKLLTQRLPFVENKIHLLTNGCPRDELFDLPPPKKRLPHEPIHLVHAGSFTGSRSTQKIAYLLAPLWMGLNTQNPKGVITLLGRLTEEDRKDIEQWQEKFSAKGWAIELVDALQRKQMMDFLVQVDGLLLLSASQAAIPSKLYEYLLLQKPIFTSTPQASAMWEIGSSLEQIFLVDYRQPHKEATESFLAACITDKNKYAIPSQFSEETLSNIFITSVLS